jgi:signal transduction histidine kinase
VKLKRVLSNLLHNALKFTDRGTIRLTASVADGTARFEVSDTGAGIAPENLPNIFNQFYRVNPSRSDGPGGLGLTIVRRYCEMLGGTVTVSSEVGRGSRFVVALPLRWEKSPADG